MTTAVIQVTGVEQQIRTALATADPSRVTRVADQAFEVEIRVSSQSVVEGTSDSGPFASAGRDNLQQDRRTFDLWGAFGSNLAFIAVMLAVGCWSVARRDF